MKAVRTGWVASGIGLVTLALFWPATGFEFLNHDDPSFVPDNPMVRGGITWPGVVWAFTRFYFSSWQPLTWLSHMLDCQLYGLNAGGHHFTSFLLHATNTVLLFLVLQSATYAPWRSAAVAMLFGCHPLHVESVAWVAERKDVVSAFFFFLTIGAYVRYARIASGEGAGNSRQSSVSRTQGRAWYALSLCCFALGLMSKAMVVTLPFVLLLLDFWPLGSLSGINSPLAGAQPQTLSHQLSTLPRLALEKLPFFLLAGLGCVAALWAEGSSNAVSGLVGLDYLPISSRAANASLSYVSYVWKLIWPAPLAVLYPYPKHVDAIPAFFSAGLLVAVSVLTLAQARRRPFLLVGWCWFLGMLVPVIGLVQFNLQVMADRYSYLPSVGFFIGVVWAGAELLARLRAPNWLGRVLATATFLSLAVCTRNQLRYWQDSVTLFAHTVEVSPESILAHYNLGEALHHQRGDLDRAMLHYRKAVQIEPHRLETANDFRDSARMNLAGILAERAQWGEAEELLHRIVRQNPELCEARSNWADALRALGRLDEAVAQYRIAIRGRPEQGEIWRRLGVALNTQRKSAEALRAYREAVRLDPNRVVALNDLAWFLATDEADQVRDGAEALRLALRVSELTGGREPRCLGTLDAALAENRRFEEAINVARQVQSLAASSGQHQTAAAAEMRLSLYQAGKPYRQSMSGQGRP